MFGNKLMRVSKLRLASILLVSTLTACAPSALQLIDTELLYQTSTLASLSAGDFDGDVTIGELRTQGDFGLGTFDALDGEMIVLDGVIYQGRDDGTATIADDAIETPYAAVTHFAADQSFVIDRAADCADLQAQIDSQLPTLDASYAIKVSGEFTTLQIRVPQKQSEPYPTLTEALVDQTLFDSQNISGTLVGFRLPDYMAGVNSAGYHFHFIDGDKQHGGHVLACRGDELAVEIDAIARIYLDLTPN